MRSPAEKVPPESECGVAGPTGHVYMSMGVSLSRARLERRARGRSEGRVAMKRSYIFVIVLAGAFFGGPGSASAQGTGMVDLAGEWATHNDEDRPHRGPGPELGDYLGLPINAAARQKAEAWDALTLSQLERQAQPHPAQYSSRGPGPSLAITRILDPVDRTLIGYRFEGYYGRADRTVWLDGRPHPSEKYGEHLWSGFSTGKFEGGKLVVTTTHLKMGVYGRNGVPSSPYARMTEVYTRHGALLTMLAWIDDPIYLEEPFVRTQTWDLSDTQFTGKALPFEPVEEIADKPRGWVPHYPLGTQHHEYLDRHDVPFEAGQGGKDTTYPEYMKRLQQLLSAKKTKAENK